MAGFLPGIVSGLHLTVRSVTQSGENVVLPQTVYPPFYRACEAAGRETVSAPFSLQAGHWTIDLQAIENKLSGHEKLLMLCNPHNPGGTVYSKQASLSQLAFAQRHDLFICSDEIHCDLILNQQPHIPIASLNADAEQRTVTLISPSKTFNIAGLGASVAIIANPQLRKQFQQARMGITPDANILAWVAAEAAWRDGQPWLDALLAYLRSAAELLSERVNRLPAVSMVAPEATYLAWIDVSALQLTDPIRYFESHGLGFSAGADFGDARFIRFIFATDRPHLEQAIQRLEKAVQQRADALCL
ncbi:MAG: Cystathionine beta-lyase PatB [Candidatus Erwinia impunctatus]|nr:Cystathionine beta-lyase PatB [Culicoides impunctatus]